MPTLNLGRVRFNWKGAYDPLEPYEEYDCIEHDGQSYVCISPVTGTSPDDIDGSTYWGDMLVRSADYNQARDDAIAAASSAETSATEAGNSATAAGDSETAAGNSEAKAGKWAEETEDVEVEAGKYSAKHWALKAQNFGDPNLLSVTADQTADERQLKDWMAQLLSTQQTANSYQDQIDTANTNASNALSASGTNEQNISDNATAIGKLKDLSATLFFKSDGSQPAWTAPTATTLETASDIVAMVGGTFVQVSAGSVVALPTLSPGTDYFIYLASDGSRQAVDADAAAPAGERLVGGFHCRAGDGEIRQDSCWDLNWRPQSYPRAMALSIDGKVWGDIYLMDTQYGLNGYSRNGATIADDGDRPVKPSIYGGDGTATYGSMSWWVAVDLATAAGKRLPFYQEFTALAYGVVERQAVGTDPVTTQHQAGHRSACGCEQITGVMWQWGADIAATGGSSWRDIAEGRGDVYASNITSPRFGAGWSSGSNAGSRASYWNNDPSNSYSYLGARGVSDHANLQAER